jgi:hypothetical protein
MTHFVVVVVFVEPVFVTLIRSWSSPASSCTKFFELVSSIDWLAEGEQREFLYRAVARYFIIGTIKTQVFF